MSAYDKLLTEMKEEFPKFRMIPKEQSTFMKALNVGLKIITLGKMKTFMTVFATTVAYTVYTPSNWEDKPNRSKIALIRHERVHMRQMRRIGRVWYAFSYLFVWFPVGLAYFRKKYETEAYEESMRFRAGLYGLKTVEEDFPYRERMIKRFTGPKYVWTWPFRKDIERWYDKTVEKIRLEMGLPIN